MRTVSSVVVVVSLWLFVVAAACDEEQETESTGGSSAEVASGAESPEVEEPEFEQPPARAGGSWQPGPLHPSLPLSPVGDDLLAYNPHRGGAHVVRGSAHTHSAPDHSGIDPAEQERRLGALDEAHRHHFVWLTAHDVVVADPGVDGVVHLHGTEIYADEGASGNNTHMVALLPNADLVGEELPFGRYRHGVSELSQRIAAADGLSVVAHPVRYSPTTEEIESAPTTLWGIEGISKDTDIAGNLAYVDARLTAGRYVCISAGADIHQEDWSMTKGFQVVSVAGQSPSATDIFRAVAACNFFACTVGNDDATPIGSPTLTVDEEGIHFDASSEVERIAFVGREGQELSAHENVSSADYLPTAEGYVRVEAHRPGDGAVCLSQPVWLLPAER